MPELTAGWILNGKAVAASVLAERSRMALSSRDPKVRAIARQLVDVRKEISSTTVGEMVVAKAEEAKGSKSASRPTCGIGRRNCPGSSAWPAGRARRDPWVELDAVRAKLPPMPSSSRRRSP